MRVKYIGLDGRVRVTRAVRLKFLEDGFQKTDRFDEYDDTVSGPVIILHTQRSQGGKRIIFEVPPSFDMSAAEAQLLEKGWLDLGECAAKTESLYKG